MGKFSACSIQPPGLLETLTGLTSSRHENKRPVIEIFLSLGMWLSLWYACLAFKKPWVQLPVPLKPDVVAHATG